MLTTTSMAVCKTPRCRHKLARYSLQAKSAHLDAGMTALYTVEPCPSKPASSCSLVSRFSIQLENRLSGFRFMLKETLYLRAHHARCSTQAQPAPSPLLMAEELDRLARRDDAMTAALIGYGLIAFLMILAHCINESLLGGEGAKAGRRCCRTKQDQVSKAPDKEMSV